MDFDALLYGPLHSVFGVTAVLTKAGGGDPYVLDVIDATSGIEVPGRTPLDIATVRPVAIVRAAALAAAGLTRADCKGALIFLNERDYRVETTQPRPTPNGEADGEVLLVLNERVL
ncbi:MAG: hypothetical protein U1E62_05440 [Alsobacter sp.]